MINLISMFLILKLFKLRIFTAEKKDIKNQLLDWNIFKPRKTTISSTLLIR